MKEQGEQADVCVRTSSLISNWLVSQGSVVLIGQAGYICEEQNADSAQDEFPLWVDMTRNCQLDFMVL